MKTINVIQSLPDQWRVRFESLFLGASYDKKNSITTKDLLSVTIKKEQKIVLFHSEEVVLHQKKLSLCKSATYTTVVAKTNSRHFTTIQSKPSKFSVKEQ